MKRTLLIVVAVLLVWGEFVAPEAAEFVMDPDELPEARVAGWRIAFTRNGTPVVGRDGRWLFDAGLNYAMPGWKEWGTQVRRSSHEDGWKKRGDSLVFHGTLHDTDRTPRFRFTETVTLLPYGLRFNYEISPLEKRRLKEFGICLHLPVAHNRGSLADFWPGLEGLQFPNKNRKGVLLKSTGRGAVIRGAEGMRVGLVFPKAVRWRTLDDRRWELNTFRVLGLDATAVRQLREGKTARLTYDLVLGEKPYPSAGTGAFTLETGPYGQLAIYSADGRRRIAGGVYDTHEGRRWMGKSARPEAGVVAESDGQPKLCGGLWESRKSTLRYSAKVKQDGDSAVLEMRLSPETDSPCPDTVRMGFYVPAKDVSVAVSGPGNTEKQNSRDESHDSPVHRVRIGFTAGQDLVLDSDREWNVQKTKISRQPCYLVSVAPIPGEDGEVLWRVRMKNTGEVKEVQR